MAIEKLDSYPGPLAGINVIDFGHYYAGPAAAMLLADQGASVIHIVKPVGLRSEGASPAQGREIPEQQYRVLNRNKKILPLDLKTTEGKEKAWALIENADVLIENFRPGVMKRLGLDYPQIKKINSGLVYLALPGFASTDKKRAHLQAWEGILGAASGLYTEASPVREILGYPPVYSWVPQCSMYGAVNGALAVMAALLAREDHGVGTQIEIPLADMGILGFNVHFLFKFPSGQLRAQADDNTELPESLQPFRYSEEDSEEQQASKIHKAFLASWAYPFRNFYPCADGRQIMLYSADHEPFVERLLRTLGIDREVKQAGFVNAGPWSFGLDNNLSNGGQLSSERRQWLCEKIAEVLLTKTAEEWETLLAKADVLAAVVRTREEWLSLKPLQKSGVHAQMDNGSSVLTTVGRAVDVSGPDNALIAGFCETETLDFAEANAFFNRQVKSQSKTIVDRELTKADLLQGLKILDMSNIAAGPLAANLLAEFGAEVIKADPPGYRFPGLVLGSAGLLQGKRSLLTDMSTAPGQEIFRRLVKQSDVVLHNILDDTASRMGASYQQLQAIKPEIVSCQLSCFGGTHRGGWEMRRGFDPVAQCASGLMAQFGTPQQPHEHGMVSSADFMSGFALAFGTLLGVYQQRKTGRGAEVRTSLARMVGYYQLPFMIAENGCSDWGEASGQFVWGENACQRIYPCSDGWIYVGATAERGRELAELVAGGARVDETALEKVFSKQSCGHWLQTLATVDIAAHQVMSADSLYETAPLREVANDAANETATASTEVLLWPEHPWGVPVTLPAPNWVRVGESPSWLRLQTAPRLGEHTTEILDELGYNKNEIVELIRLKVAHEYLPALGSKTVFY